jgi:hypothetical protein
MAKNADGKSTTANATPAKAEASLRANERRPLRTRPDPPISSHKNWSNKAGHVSAFSWIKGGR